MLGNNILFVGAHHDDLEISIGGTVKRLSLEGKKVYSAILTDSTWVNEKGERFRDPKKVLEYCNNAAEILGYIPINLSYGPCFTIEYSDDKVVTILNLIHKYNIDTLITIWPYDAHRDHRVASQIALAASRTVSRVLVTRLSWNKTIEKFDPNFFISIDDTIEYKLKAIRCYKDEYARNQKKWEKYIYSTANLYGLESGSNYAEGFNLIKFLI